MKTGCEIRPVILLMEEILVNQLRLVVYPIIYKVSYMPGGVGFLPSTVPPVFGWYVFWGPNDTSSAWVFGCLIRDKV